MNLKEKIFTKDLKLLIWSISAGTIVGFFYGTNILSWATSFNPGGGMLFISPLVCGFILGILTWDYEISHAVYASIVLTLTASIWIIVLLTAPSLFGVAMLIDRYYLYITQNILLAVVMVFPVSLLGSIVGKYLTGSALLSPEVKVEKQHLKVETEEWYQMLEDFIESKTDAPIPPEQERIRRLIEIKAEKLLAEREAECSEPEEKT